MDETKTVGSDKLALREMQKQDVAAMRTSLLTVDPTDSLSTRIAIRNITVMRVQHQLMRIVKYTDMMDKIEEKMYDSIDATLEGMNEFDEATWVKLVALQEKLQKNMIESHKLLEPYLNIEEFTNLEVQSGPDSENTFNAMILDQQARDKIRSGAQALLSAINSGGPDQ